MLKTANATNPASPSSAVRTRPWLTRTPPRMAGSVKTGSASRPPIPISENVVRAPTAVPVSNPAVVSMANWTAAPAASPPGRLSVTAFPARPAVTTANQPLVRRASRCRAKLQVNEISSAASMTVNHTGLSVDSRGHAPSTAMSFGNRR